MVEEIEVSFSSSGSCRDNVVKFFKASVGCLV